MTEENTKENLQNDQDFGNFYNKNRKVLKSWLSNLNDELRKIHYRVIKNLLRVTSKITFINRTNFDEYLLNSLYNHDRHNNRTNLKDAGLVKGTVVDTFVRDYFETLLKNPNNIDQLINRYIKTFSPDNTSNEQTILAFLNLANRCKLMQLLFDSLGWKVVSSGIGIYDVRCFKNGYQDIYKIQDSTIRKNLLLGEIDLLCIDPEGNLIPIDIKTSGSMQGFEAIMKSETEIAKLSRYKWFLTHFNATAENPTETLSVLNPRLIYINVATDESTNTINSKGMPVLKSSNFVSATNVDGKELYLVMAEMLPLSELQIEASIYNIVTSKEHSKVEPYASVAKTGQYAIPSFSKPNIGSSNPILPTQTNLEETKPLNTKINEPLKIEFNRRTNELNISFNGEIVYNVSVSNLTELQELGKKIIAEHINTFEYSKDSQLNERSKLESLRYLSNIFYNLAREIKTPINLRPSETLIPCR